MKYISESTIINFWIEIIEFSSSNKILTNKFFGFLELFKFLNSESSSIRPNTQYCINSSDISESLQEKYYFDESTLKNFNSEDKLYLMLSNNWEESISILLLKNVHLPLEWVAAICLQNETFGKETENSDILNIFIKKYKLDSVIELFFDRSKSEILFSESKPNRKNIFNSIKRHFKLEDKGKFTLGFEKNLIQANPGELTRGPFIQPLYSGQENLKSLILSNFKFSDYYNISPYTSGDEEKTSFNKRLIEKQKLKWIIFNTFKFLLKNYDEKILFEGYVIKESKINDTIYDGLFLPQYFATDNLIGIYKTEQIKEDLKSSGTQRFFEDNIRILGNEFAYFTTQWGDTEGKYKTLQNFNKFLSEKSGDTLEIIKDGNLFTLISKTKNKTTSPLKKTEQIIYYGAPGTGKSYKVDKEINVLDPTYYERITFHPEFDHTSFIGGYKPVTENNEIKYKFVPQAFTDIYTRAWNDQENQYYLVIEEINRGNCAEIFGDIFQLLDRNSKYSVTPSNELKEYLIKEFNNESHEGIINGLKLPPNLSILATMNTSDQSLFPMDSAFKRRWDWEYIPICYNDTPENQSFHYKVILDEKNYFKWIDFIKNVNAIIKSNPNLGMDKCIGNYFIKSESKQIELKDFINKAIFYLWNDVFKDEDSSNSIFEKATTYEDFFPIETNGKENVEKILKSLEIETTTKVTT